MSFEILKEQPPRRPAEMLIRDPVKLEGRDEEVVPYDMVWPGLYQDETVARLDTGDLVAISVNTNLIGQDGMITGGGMEFRGWARLIEPDGSTKRDPAGQEMELVATFAPTPLFIESRATDTETGEQRIAREILRLMLGEEPTMIPIAVDPDAPPNPEVAVDAEDYRLHPEKAPPGTFFDEAATETPLVGWDLESRLNNSIVHAIRLRARASGAAGVDAAALLTGP